MKITTLEKVFNRVDALSQNCFDQNVDVKDLTFENLDSVNIAGESHPLQSIAQRSITWRLGGHINICGVVQPRSNLLI